MAQKARKINGLRGKTEEKFLCIISNYEEKICGNRRIILGKMKAAVIGSLNLSQPFWS